MCSSAPAAPSTQSSTVDLPDWAKPYAKETLAKTKALTDINQNPYQQYGGERIAGFQPMQEQAFKTMSGMDASPEGFAKGIGSYMSPYMQNVVDIQKREAGRQSDIAGTQQQAQATQAGAFGGGRDAIMRAERERNLGQQMNDIQAKGSQAAFDQASGQFRQGITQQSGLAQMQGQMGQQQQQQAQRPLDMAYQDFQNQQNYPYKQLGFMSDMVNKLPLGQKSTSQIYDQGPGTVQTLASLGGAAYGFGKSGMFGAEGGLMESYADGGVTSPQNVESILSRLSDQQLAQAKEAALNRRDVQEAQMIDAEMAERASIRGGMGSAFNQIPQDRQEAMMAGGGMVAFAPGGVAKGGSYLDKMQEAQQQQMNYIRQATTPQTPEQQKTDILAQKNVLKDLYPESVIPQYLTEVKAERAALPEKMESDKGLAFAMASLKLLSRNKKPGENQTSQFVSGLGEAGEAFAGEVNRLKKEHREADRLLRQSELQLATAHQLHEDGMTDRAVAAKDKSQALIAKAAEMHAGVAGDTAKIYGQLQGTKLGADATVISAGIHAGATERAAAMAASKPSAQKEGAMAIFNDPSFAPGKSSEERYRLATERYLELTKTGIPGVNARIEATAREKATKDFNDAIAPGGPARKEYMELQKKGTPEQVKEFKDRLFNEFFIMHSGEAAPAPGATQQAPAARQQQQAAPPPPLNVWMDAARKANPGVSDADLAKYYNSKYGK